MAQGAAFFDLDRTLLAGASGTVFAAAMREAGLAGRQLPGERLLFGLFNRIGETLPSMVLARQGAALARGKSQRAVRDAAKRAASELADIVQPFAAGLIATHHAAGRPTVLATTTPRDWVEPLAELLGLDDVVATRYGVEADGMYSGRLDGPFVWSAGKLSAVAAWAEEHDVALAESYAYSDSVYDVPLLSAVGHPTAVNPDARLVVVATMRRWPVLHLDVPPGVAKVPVLDIELQRLFLQFARPLAFPYARFDIAGAEQIPEKGGAIIVANHRSYFDPAAIAVTIARTGRTVRYLGKKEVFDAPVIGPLARAMGGIRVDRGSGDREPLTAAIEALAAGEMVALMPQGTIPRGPAFFDPDLKGRSGAARLAAASGAPVIPIGIWGTEQVWPRSGRLPNILNLTAPPTVRVRVGKQVPLKLQDPASDTKRIMTAITKLLPPEARRRHEPTPEELARTYPPGKAPKPNGTD